MPLVTGACMVLESLLKVSAQCFIPNELGLGITSSIPFDSE